MLKICLVCWESEPQYAYKRYAYKKKHVVIYIKAQKTHDVGYLNLEIESLFENLLHLPNQNLSIFYQKFQKN